MILLDTVLVFELNKNTRAPTYKGKTKVPPKILLKRFSEFQTMLNATLQNRAKHDLKKQKNTFLIVFN